MSTPLDSLSEEPTVDVNLNLPEVDMSQLEDVLTPEPSTEEATMAAQAPTPVLETPKEAKPLPAWAAAVAKQDEDGNFGAGLTPAPSSAPVEAAIERPSIGSQLATAFTDDGKAIVSGITKAAANTVDGLNYITGYKAFLDKSYGRVIPNLRQESESFLKKVEPETGGGKLVEGFTQFLTNFIPASAGLKSVGMAGTVSRGFAAGAVSDFFSFGAKDPRLSNIIEEIPSLSALHPVASVLAARPDDNEFWGRIKNTVEGGLVGVVTESAIKVIGEAVLKGMKASAAKAQGASPKEVKKLAPTAKEAEAANAALGDKVSKLLQNDPEAQAAYANAVGNNQQETAQLIIDNLMSDEAGKRKLTQMFVDNPEYHAVFLEARSAGDKERADQILKDMVMRNDPAQAEFAFPAYNEKGGDGFKLEGEVGATPAPTMTKPLAYDEAGQSSFDFYGDLVKRETPAAEGDVKVSSSEAPTTLDPNSNPELDFSRRVADLEGKKVKATFQGETGFLEVQGDTLVLRKPRSKTVYEVGPASPDKPLSQFEGLEVVEQKERGKVASPAENSAAALVKQEGNAPQTRSKLETWADDTIKDSKGRLNMGVDPELLAAYAVKGSYYIARGVKSLAEFSAKMLAEFGDTVKPHLMDLWKQAQEIHAQPKLGAEKMVESMASRPSPNPNRELTFQAKVAFEKYFDDSEASIANAAKAAGILNLNTYDPSASGTKLVEAVATTIEEAIRSSRGETRTLEKRAKDAAQFLVDSGNGEALARLQAGNSGLRLDAQVTAYQLLLTDAKIKLQEASDLRLSSPSIESDMAHEAAFDHYSKIMVSMAGDERSASASEVGKALNAFKQVKDWQKVVDAALSAANPDRALRETVAMSWGDIAIGAARELFIGNLLSYSSAAITAFGGGLNGAVKITKQLLGARDITTAMSAVKQYGYVIQHLGDAFENMRVAVASHEPRFTTHTAVDELAGGAFVDRSRYPVDAVNKFRSRGFISSETAFNKLGFDPMESPLWAVTAGALDTGGEVVRASNRLVLGADEFVKTAYGLSYLKARFNHEGIMAGMEGEALDGFVKSKMDSILLRDRRLYTKENFLRQLAQDVHADGFRGHEAAVQLETRFKAQWDVKLGEAAQEAQRYADEVSMMEPFEDGVLKDSYNWMRNHPWITLGAGMVFFRQAVNAFRQAAQQFPMLGLASKTRAKMLASGDPFQMAEARGRSAFGLAMTAFSAAAAMSGFVTGAGPRDPEQRKLKSGNKFIPYAFRIPKNSEGAKRLLKEGFKMDGHDEDYYYLQFSRMDPIAIPLQVFASFGDFIKEAHYDQDSDVQDKVAAATMATFLMVFDLAKEKSGMNTLKQVSKLLDQRNTQDGNKMWDAFGVFLQQKASVVVPAMASKVLTSNDTVATQAYTLLQQLAQRTGQNNFNTVGKAIGLPPQFVPRQWNILGEKIDKAVTETPAVNIINPFLVSSGKDDKLVSEMLSLKHPWNAPSRYHSVAQANDVWDMRQFQYAEPTKKKGVSFVKDVIDGGKAVSGSVPNKPALGQDAYDRWNELIGVTKIDGMTLRERLTKTTESPEYNQLPPQDRVIIGGKTGRIDVISSVIREYRDQAFAQVLSEYPEFNKVYQTKMGVQKLSKTQTAEETKQFLKSPDFQKILDFSKPTP